MHGDLARRMPCSPHGTHEAFDGAAGHVTRPVTLGDLGLVEHHVHLADPEHCIVVGVDSLHLGLEGLLTHAPDTGRPGPASCSNCSEAILDA